MNSLGFNITKEGLEKEVGDLDIFADKLINSIAKMMNTNRSDVKQKYEYAELRDDPYLAYFDFGFIKNEYGLSSNLVCISEETSEDGKYHVYDDVNIEDFYIKVDTKREAIKQAIKYGVNKNGDNNQHDNIKSV